MLNNRDLSALRTPTGTTRRPEAPPPLTGACSTHHVGLGFAQLVERNNGVLWRMLVRLPPGCAARPVRTRQSHGLRGDVFPPGDVFGRAQLPASASTCCCARQARRTHPRGTRSAELVERNNGVFGGCWCVGYHPERGQRGINPAAQIIEDRVRTGRARAASVIDEHGAAQGWCQYGDPSGFGIKHRREYSTRMLRLWPHWRITWVNVTPSTAGRASPRGAAGRPRADRPTLRRSPMRRARQRRAPGPQPGRTRARTDAKTLALTWCKAVAFGQLPRSWTLGGALTPAYGGKSVGLRP